MAATKTTFPFRLYSALLVAALLVWLAWCVWQPEVRVTRPTLDIGSETAVVATHLTNRGSNARAVTIRFQFGYQVMGTDYAASRFQVLATRDVEAEIDANTTQTVTCEFTHPQKHPHFLADAQIVSLR